MMRRARSIVLSILCMLTLCGLCFGLIACEKQETHVHTEVTLEAVAPTCTAPGLTEGKKCSECGITLVAQEIVPKLGHDLKDLARQDPTCTQPGRMAGRYCVRENCNYTEGGGIVLALGHDLQPVEGTAQAASCETAGKEADTKCSRCSYTETGKGIEALGHAVADDAPWKQDADTHYKECTRANCDKGGKVEATAHTALADTYEQGYEQGINGHYEVCETCGATFNFTAHSSREFGRVEATCLRAGCESGTECSVCGLILSIGKEIPATGHSFGSDTPGWSSDPVLGIHYHACTNSNCDFGGKVDATACTPEEAGQYSQKPEGKHYQTCTVCSQEYNIAEHTPANANEYFEVTEEDEEFSDHENEHYQVCKYCKEKFNFAEHQMENVDQLDSTCLTAGHQAGTKCKFCEHHTGMDVIETSGHQFVDIEGTAIKENCVAEGKKADQKCSICDTVEEGAVIPALGHDIPGTDNGWHSIEVDGVEYHYHTCQRDGCDAEGKADYAAHTATTWTKGTASNNNHHSQTCTVCKLKFNDKDCNFEGKEIAKITTSNGCGYTCDCGNVQVVRSHNTYFEDPEKAIAEYHLVFTQKVSNTSSTPIYYHTYTCELCGTEVGSINDSRCSLPTSSKTNDNGYIRYSHGVHYCDENYDWVVCRYCKRETEKTPHARTEVAGSQTHFTTDESHPGQHNNICSVCSAAALSNLIGAYNDKEACEGQYRNHWEDHIQAPEDASLSYRYARHTDQWPWQHGVLCICGAEMRQEPCTVTAVTVNEYYHNARCSVCFDTYVSDAFRTHVVVDGKCSVSGCTQENPKSCEEHQLNVDENGYTDGSCKTCGESLVWTFNASSFKKFVFDKTAATELEITKLKIPSEVIVKAVSSGVKRVNSPNWKEILKGATMLTDVYVDIECSFASATPLEGWFSGCTNLKTVIFGEKFNTLLGKDEFTGCTNLETVIFLKNDTENHYANWQSKPFGADTSNSAMADKSVIDDLHIYFGSTPTELGIKRNVKSSVYTFYKYVNDADATFWGRVHFAFKDEEALSTYQSAADDYFNAWKESGATAFKFDADSGTQIEGTHVKITQLTQPNEWQAAAAAAMLPPEAILPTAAKEAII